MDLINNPLLVVLAGIAIVALIFWYVATEIDRRKRNVGSIAILLVIGLCLAAVLPFEEKLKKGIDLAGGVAFTVEIQSAEPDPGQPPLPVGPEAIEAVKKTLGERLSEGSMSGVQMQGLGEDRLVIEMAALNEEQIARMKVIIEKTAQLTCKAVHPESDRLAQAVENGSQLAPAGWKLYQLPVIDQKTLKKIGDTPILLAKRNIVTGDQVQRAIPVPSRFGTIQVRLNSDGGDRLFNATAQMREGVDRMAVVLDGQALIAPTVNGNLSRSFIIEGLDGSKEVNEVVAALANPLKNPLEILSTNQISAKYGKEIVRQGVTAALAGLALTLIFILLYYRFAGIVALLGLSLNILILFGAMAMFGATFTLPGIAGIILTIGIAVDANVLIYERLREEMADGKSVAAALKASYEKAFTAIFDANITTILTALILLWQASDQIKGFAITLTIGILASMFAALLGTRVFFFWFAGTGQGGKVKKMSFMSLIPNRTIKFMQMRNPAFVISAILVIGSLATITMRRDTARGIDFVGGTILTIQVDAEHKIEADDIDASLADITLTKTPYAQKEIIAGGNTDLLKVKISEEDVDLVQAELRKDIPLLAEKDATGTYVTPISSNTIAPTLGEEFFKNSLYALGMGLLAVLLYISLRFEFSFAVGAFVALFHDLIISVGAVLLIGTELSMIHVGAFLTIAGYSINDTIVVFDRVRESLQSKRGSIVDVMNLAINATLSRTILTSVTTFMAVLVLYIFGGAALKDFSFAIMIGVVIGTYSSIFVATPVVYLWSKARGSNLRRELLDANLAAEITPAKK
ncbi:MAG: protein translocase subunit SecF [Akkermansiaceae bacterium]